MLALLCTAMNLRDSPVWTVWTRSSKWTNLFFRVNPFVEWTKLLGKKIRSFWVTNMRHRTEHDDHLSL